MCSISDSRHPIPNFRDFNADHPPTLLEDTCILAQLRDSVYKASLHDKRGSELFSSCSLCDILVLALLADAIEATKILEFCAQTIVKNADIVPSLLCEIPFLNGKIDYLDRCGDINEIVRVFQTFHLASRGFMEQLEKHTTNTFCSESVSYVHMNSSLEDTQDRVFPQNLSTPKQISCLSDPLYSRSPKSEKVFEAPISKHSLPQLRPSSPSGLSDISFQSDLDLETLLSLVSKPKNAQKTPPNPSNMTEQSSFQHTSDSENFSCNSNELNETEVAEENLDREIVEKSLDFTVFTASVDSKRTPDKFHLNLYPIQRETPTKSCYVHNFNTNLVSVMEGEMFEYMLLYKCLCSFYDLTVLL